MGGQTYLEEEALYTAVGMFSDSPLSHTRVLIVMGDGTVLGDRMCLL